MGIYENGIDTRKAILNACTTLFFEKGYHGTSIDDICQAAHVNRGSIYYHFKDKENIRYEVMWDIIMESLSRVRNACTPVPQKYEYAAAMYAVWEQICVDENTQRFFVEYSRDYPVYSPRDNLSRTVIMLLDQMNRQIRPDCTLDRVGTAAVYGLIISLTLLAQKPEYTAPALFQQIFTISNLIRGVPREEISNEWMTIQPLILPVSQ